MRAADDPQFAGAELEPHQRGEVAARDDHPHSDESERRAERLPGTERLAEHEAGEHHRHDRRQGHDDAGGGRVGVVEAGIDHALAERQADRADGQHLQCPRSEERDHRRVVTMHDRQQDRAGERQPPEAQRPGRHLRSGPLCGDVDAGREEPAEGGREIRGQRHGARDRLAVAGMSYRQRLNVRSLRFCDDLSMIAAFRGAVAAGREDGSGPGKARIRESSN